MKGAICWVVIATVFAVLVGLPSVGAQAKKEQPAKKEVQKKPVEKNVVKLKNAVIPPDEEMQPASTGLSGFQGSNGFTDDPTFAADQLEFEDTQDVSTGLGPVFNNTGCALCHNNPVTGGLGNFTELRAGKFDGTQFVPHLGGSLIQFQAVDPSIVERAFADFPLRGLRTAVPLFGDGFIECISNTDISGIVAKQPFGMKGEYILVPVLEAPGQVRVGRFGWKNQHASLLSFAADAYVNEIGVTSALQPTPNTSNGKDALSFVPTRPPDPVDVGGADGNGADIERFTRFMRALKVPPRDAVLAATPEAAQGLAIFRKIGCNICHVEQFTTAPAGTSINGGKFTIPAALGGKVIQPFSDFLLHDVGTGDGIVMNGPQDTSTKFRTVPLWGLRIKSRLMHDGATFTRNDAILRHGGEAAGVVAAYQALTINDQQLLILFLRSL